LATILVIGYGSIGSRHARIARELGHDVHVVSRRGAAENFRAHADVSAALSDRDFDAAVVATETGRHVQDITTLADDRFTGRVLVEKPLAASEVMALNTPLELQARTWVAYNLRHHPVIGELRRRLAGATLLNLSCHVGQHLGQWRSGRAIGDTYSSRQAAGGGVLRDLSHELDYLLWLFGPWTAVAATGGKIGDLGGDADDCWAISIRFANGMVGSIGLDYFCHRPVRRLLVNTDRDTFDADLVASRLTADETVEWPAARDLTYRLQLEALLTPSPPPTLCTFEEGVAVTRLIGAIETASREGKTIHP
jgi:predicted dehydrogenase